MSATDIRTAARSETPTGYAIRRDGLYWNGMELDDIMCAKIYPTHKSARFARMRLGLRDGVAVAVVDPQLALL